MARPIGLQGKVVMDYLKRFPKAKSRTLARKIYNENKSVFTNYTGAYGLVRNYRGTNGKFSRKHYLTKTFMKNPEPIPACDFPDLPAERSEYSTPWEAVKIVGAYRALILSDIHIPYHSLTALKVAMNYGKQRGCNLILLNGDTADNHSISKFETDPRSRDFPGEIKAVRQFLTALRKAFPVARIIWKDGNHDERFSSYLMNKAEELLGLEQFDWPNIIGLSNNGIEYVTDKRPIMLGDLPVIHGHEYKSGFAAPVNPARGFFLRAKTHCLGSHHHQTSQHSEKSLTGKVISTWSTGCLCQMNPRYMPLNNHNHGFAEVETTMGGEFRVENKKILGGEIY